MYFRKNKNIEREAENAVGKIDKFSVVMQFLSCYTFRNYVMWKLFKRYLKNFFYRIDEQNSIIIHVFMYVVAGSLINSK